MNSKFKMDFSKVEPYKNAPSLAWLLSQRVVGPTTQDVTIGIYGHKGAGKSMFSIGLAYSIAKALAYHFNKKELDLLKGEEFEQRLDELSKNHFVLSTHMKSCDPDGNFDLFSGEVMTKKYQVLIADDFSISAGSRDSMSTNNKALGKICTIMRPFSNILIFNTITSGNVDKIIRNIADIIIELQGVDIKRNRSLAKVYLYSINQTTGREYRKFYRWNNMRITHWFSHLPPVKMKKEYEAIRMEKTLELVESLRVDREERKNRGNKTIKKQEDLMNKFYDIVIEKRKNGESIRSIAKMDPSLSEYKVNRILAKGGLQ